MQVDPGLQRMLDVEFDKIEPILKQTLLERAPAFGVSAETQAALRDLPEGRYTCDELLRELASRGAS